jgi:uncharacterized membrane protein YhaH (DUF805 family)
MAKKVQSKMISFQDAVVSFFQKWADFKGIATRAEYWWAMLFMVLVNLVIGWIPFVGVLISIVLLVPTLAITVRRLHDMGQSGHWMWGYLLCVPYLLSLVVVILTGGGMAYAAAAGLFGLIFVVWAIVVFIFTLLPSKISGNKYRK